MQTLIQNRHGRPLLWRISFTRALQKTRPCSASHHLSKMCKRWQMIGLLSINHSVKTKDKKHQGGEGNGLNPATIFTGGLGNSGVVVHGRLWGEWVKEVSPMGKYVCAFQTLKNHMNMNDMSCFRQIIV